jgi:hypothetical protein
MGVDWIPCRVETGHQTEELCELVRREALHFRISDSPMPEASKRVAVGRAAHPRKRGVFISFDPEQGSQTI